MSETLVIITAAIAILTPQRLHLIEALQMTAPLPIITRSGGGGVQHFSSLLSAAATGWWLW